MTESETEILGLITHIETYVDATNLVVLNERQRKLIVDILDGYTANQASSFTSSPPPLIAPHNSSERLPSSDAANGGGDTTRRASGCRHHSCEFPTCDCDPDGVAE